MHSSHSQHHFTPKGTSDDIVSLLMHAGLLSPTVESTFVAKLNRSRSQFWLQPLGNLIGLVISGIALLVPANKMLALQKKMALKLAVPFTFSFDTDSAHLNSAKQLMAQIQTKTGVKPAVLCLFEHLSVEQEEMKLNFQLASHTLSALNWLDQKSKHSKCVLAIDSFALTGWGNLIEDIYAGLMGTYHLGFDRLSTYRRGLSRLLLGKTSSHRIPFRISRTLHRRVGLGMAHTGGIPSTGRVLYTAREYLYLLRQYRNPHLAPETVLIHLQQLSPDFAAFQQSGLVGARLQHNTWKMMEAWLVAFLTSTWNFAIKSDQRSCAEMGVLNHDAVTIFMHCAEAMEVEQSIAENILADFKAEFSRNVPERKRLFRLLAQRVVAKGTPVLLLPLNAGDPNNRAMVWGKPVVLTGYHNQQLNIVTLDENQKMNERTLPLGTFVKEFNREHFC